MKISVIGSGNVGATVAQRLVEKELGDVVLIDILEGVPQGKGLDMMESGPIEGFDSEITGTNDFGAMKDSDIVIITAGLPRKPGMSRMDLLQKNAKIIEGISKDIARYCPKSIVVVVTNPLDVMCYVAKVTTGFDKKRVFGMAGVLDSARFRTFIAMELGVSVKDVQAMVLGGHGDEMVPLPRFSTVSGIPIREFLSDEKIEALVKRTREGGAEIVSLLKTGSAYYAPSSSVARMVESIVKDEKRILPASAWLEGEYGLRDVYVGVPVKLGLGGIEEVIQLKLDSRELALLHKSANVVQENIKGLYGR
jgi:malate dehydrogenase